MTHPLSQFSGDDAEGSDGTGGLQVQGRQKTLWGLAGVQSLQGLTQTTPGLVGGAVDLNCVTQNLLPELNASCFHQQTALDGGRREGENDLASIYEHQIYISNSSCSNGITAANSPHVESCDL